MNLLQIDSSALGQGSATRELTAEVVRRWRARFPGLQLVRRDLDADPVPHLTGRSLAREDAEEAALGERLLDEFLAADVIVIGAPMYNFSIPSTLKAWIDRIAIAGKTFRYTADGPKGLAGGRRVIVASARGGRYGDGSPADFQEAYLRQLFGFLGIDDVEVVRAEGVAISPETRQASLGAALASIPVPRAAIAA